MITFAVFVWVFLAGVVVGIIACAVGLAADDQRKAIDDTAVKQGTTWSWILLVLALAGILMINYLRIAPVEQAAEGWGPGFVPK